jgi:geranylgeranyl pyrophosphate synthase
MMQSRERSLGIGKDLALVEAALEGAAASDVELLSWASKHIICAGGKRLRPRVLLLSYRATGGTDIAGVVPLAAAVELLHTASLIHDDINDCSDVRRGQATINARWGDSVALLTGDFVFVKLFGMMAAFESRIIRVFADACSAIVEGETLHMLNRGDAVMSEELYLEIVTRKTASLFSACAEVGGILAGGTEQHIGALRDYGLNLGIAFQIRDDALDMAGKSEDLGKPVGVDLEQGKMSLATLYALERSERAREVLLSTDVRQAAELLRDTGALDYAMQKAGEYSNKGKKALSIFPCSEARAALCDLADFAVARDR